MELLFIFIGVIFILILVFLVWAYNSLTTLKTQVEEAWSGIDVQLKRRYVLVPQLVETVKHYVTQEKTILTQITELRAKSMSESHLTQKANLEDQLSGNIRKVSIIVENYPELKSSENYINLMNQLFEIEDQIQMSRRYYNGTVRNLNIRIKIFPVNIISGLFGFKEVEFFEAEENAKQDVKVEL